MSEWVDVWDERVDRRWQASVLLFMARTALHAAEPDEIIDQWTTEAAEGDSTALAWVLLQWEKVRRLQALDLERLIDHAQRAMVP
jgi:hypothetical protein